MSAPRARTVTFRYAIHVVVTDPDVDLAEVESTTSACVAESVAGGYRGWEVVGPIEVAATVGLGEPGGPRLVRVK